MEMGHAGGLPENEGAPDRLARDALEALQFNWGEAYEIATSGAGTWSARRRDGLGGPIEAPGPGELRKAIIEDYSVRPVPKDGQQR